VEEIVCKEGVFPLTVGDLGFVTFEVTVFTEMLISRADWTPRQLVGLARALYAIKQLPDITPGVDVDIEVTVKLGDEIYGETKSWKLRITEDTFEVSSGSSFHDNRYGTDLVTGLRFFAKAGIDGCRTCNDSSYEFQEQELSEYIREAILKVVDKSISDCIPDDDTEDRGPYTH
jgi:hypothetical protein